MPILRREIAPLTCPEPCRDPRRFVQEARRSSPTAAAPYRATHVSIAHSHSRPRCGAPWTSAPGACAAHQRLRVRHPADPPRQAASHAHLQGEPGSSLCGQGDRCRRALPPPALTRDRAQCRREYVHPGVRRTQPPLPLRAGHAVRHTHDYPLHSVVDLFAALEIATGKVTHTFNLAPGSVMRCISPGARRPAGKARRASLLGISER